MKIFEALMNFEGLVCEERAFYALMVQEQKEDKQVRPYILNTLERGREPTI